MLRRRGVLLVVCVRLVCNASATDGPDVAKSFSAVKMAACAPGQDSQVGYKAVTAPGGDAIFTFPSCVLNL